MGDQDVMDVWSKVIPKFAITIQLTLDSAITLAFTSSGNNTNTNLLPNNTTIIATNSTDTIMGEFTCHGRSEFVWRTTLFGITLIIGWFFMKHFDQDVLFHEVMNLFLVSGWLFTVSNYPITCWIQPNGVLTKDESRNLTLLRLFVTTIINNVWVVLETSKPEWVLMFFRQLSRLLMMCARPLQYVVNQFDRLLRRMEGNINNSQGNTNDNGGQNTNIPSVAPNTMNTTPANNNTQDGNVPQGSSSAHDV